jgi:hypothetical protein
VEWNGVLAELNDQPEIQYFSLLTDVLGEDSTRNETDPFAANSLKKRCCTHQLTTLPKNINGYF